jgi:hypothetical protein
VPGSRVVPNFEIAGDLANVITVTLPGLPLGPPTFLLGKDLFVQELFLLNGKNLLQLTAFRRADTLAAFLATDGRRVFFVASADPLGHNPSENCQIFSVDTLAGHLRQHTRFRQGNKSNVGCFTGPPPGCGIFGLRQDPMTRTVLFDSGCDPLGANPHGQQLFAMRPDGSDLRQLTRLRGIETNADGRLTVELPGPWAYSASRCDLC